MNFKTIPAIILAGFFLVSCHFSAKETIHDAGDKVGQGGGALVHGLKGGVTKAFTHEIEISEELKKAGLGTGEVTLSDTLERTSIVNVYFIFDRDFEKNVTLKVFDNKGLEMGRCRLMVKGKGGEAHFFDFRFDRHTDIANDCKLTLE